MSAFILDASYTLAWCFPDRATANTDATLKRLEAREDYAIVPWVWQVEGRTKPCGDDGTLKP